MHLGFEVQDLFCFFVCLCANFTKLLEQQEVIYGLPTSSASYAEHFPSLGRTFHSNVIRGKYRTLLGTSRLGKHNIESGKRHAYVNKNFFF